MNILGFEFSVKKNKAPEPPAVQEKNPDVTAWAGGYYGGNNYVNYRPFDGERTLGGVGPINKYMLDHDGLRLRSWQLLLESEIVQIGIQRYVMWLIGTGLKLRAEPVKGRLDKFGIKVDVREFCKEIEEMWHLYSNSPISDDAGMETLHQKMYEAEINALVGGDCLFMINIDDNGLPAAVLKDGAHVRTPMFGAILSGFDVINPDTGYRIRHGVEFDEKGTHIAYWVRKGSNYDISIADWLNYERVPARDEKTGFTRAFLYYGLRYRLDDIRGIPLISVCMETAKQLEIYKEATVSSAVERAKITLVAEHELGAIGGNVFDSQLAKATGGPWADLPKTNDGTSLNAQVAATTGKQFLNPMPGTKIKSVDSKQELHFSEFYETNMKIIFAAIGIPFEVAVMVFGGSYSGSRASIKDWEHTLIVKRIKNVKPAYAHIYNMFLLTSVLKNEISAPGYLAANGIGGGKKNVWVKLAYENTKWQGSNPPNIDELKEVNAVRAKLGLGSAHAPLITIEDGMDQVGNNGDFRHVADQYQEELEYCDDIGIEKEDLITGVPEGGGEEEKETTKPKKVTKKKPTKKAA